MYEPKRLLRILCHCMCVSDIHAVRYSPFNNCTTHVHNSIPIINGLIEGDYRFCKIWSYRGGAGRGAGGPGEEGGT